MSLNRSRKSNKDVLIEVEVLNWKQHETRKGSNNNWFKFDHYLFTYDAFYRKKCAVVAFWVYILCEISKHNCTTVTLSAQKVRDNVGLSLQNAQKVLSHLNDFNYIRFFIKNEKSVQIDRKIERKIDAKFNSNTNIEETTAPAHLFAGDTQKQKNCNKPSKPQVVDPDPRVVEVIEFLNKLAKTKFKPDSNATTKHVLARLVEGNTVEDLKQVIKIKVKEWVGTEMEKYLRPSTLFNSAKFDEYLGQPYDNFADLFGTEATQ